MLFFAAVNVGVSWQFLASPQEKRPLGLDREFNAL
jgi:hypothetical protein